MSFIEKIKDAVTDFKTHNKSFESIYNLGVDLFKDQNYEQAILFFEKAARKNEPQPQVFYNLALSYQYVNEIDNAVSNYTKFLTQVPQDYDGMYNLGLILFQINKKTQALELFEKCLNIKKEAPLIELLSKYYLEKNLIEKLLELNNTILSDTKTSDLAIIIARELEIKQGFGIDGEYIDYAIDIYKNILKLNPENEKAAYNCSLIYSKKGDWENSIHYCKKALELNNNSLDSNEQMGLVSYCANDMENAVKYFEKTFELKKNLDYKTYSNLAYAYEKNGDKEKAIKTFESLLRNFEDCPIKEEIISHLTLLKTN